MNKPTNPKRQLTREWTHQCVAWSLAVLHTMQSRLLQIHQKLPIDHFLRLLEEDGGKMVIHPNLILRHYSAHILFTEGQSTAPRLSRVPLHCHLSHFKTSLLTYASSSFSLGDTDYSPSLLWRMLDHTFYHLWLASQHTYLAHLSIYFSTSQVDCEVGDKWLGNCP